MHFVEADIGHIPAIVSLAQRIWRAHYPGIISAEQIEFMLAHRYAAHVIEQDMQRGERYFIAYADEQAVAYGSFEKMKDSYYLHKFYVDVQQHSRGIGSRFFNFLLQSMDDAKYIRLQVNRSNYKAVNFYFKQGFVIEATGDFDIGGGYFMNDFVMVRTPR